MKTKFKLILGMLLMVVWGGAQTVEIEAEILNRGISEKKWDPVETQERAKLWKQERGNYPKIPYDTVLKKVIFQHIIKFDGISKQQAFKRCKEWAAFEFNKLDAVTEYEDAESGKLILEGWVRIPFTQTYKNVWGNTKSAPSWSDLYFSLMVTLVDGKAKVSYHNLRFESYIPGYAIGNIYIPSEIVKSRFESLFPIVDHDFASWGGIFDLLRNSLADINATAPSLEKYINGLGGDYRF
jgi:hypothetical protein